MARTGAAPLVVAVTKPTGSTGTAPDRHVLDAYNATVGIASDRVEQAILHADGGRRGGSDFCGDATPSEAAARSLRSIALQPHRLKARGRKESR